MSSKTRKSRPVPPKQLRGYQSGGKEATTPTIAPPALSYPEPRPISRIPAVEVFPSIEGGTWPAKAVAGESIPVRATVFREGHDALGAEVVLYGPDGAMVDCQRMVDIAPGLDRLEAWVTPRKTGPHAYTVRTYSDAYVTWVHDASLKISAGVDVELVFIEGARLMKRAAAGGSVPNVDGTKAPNQDGQEHLLEVARLMSDGALTPQERLSAGLSARTRRIMAEHPLRDLCEETMRYPLQVDRPRALYGSWYEVFPRSYGATQNEDGSWVSGTFAALEADLGRIAGMGFDVLYLTPVHPIGTQFRKGKNNSLTAAPGDPGSPYGIGAAEGGHDTLHPDLGSFDDFDHLVAAAREQGLEVALDLALQCSPDHPWVKEHPEWFSQRADGSIAYAENPPKKYQDIYPLNFDHDFEGLYNEIVRVVELWISHGVTIFRVDNPHTKPLTFWQRFLRQMRSDHPDVLFLAEAFTRPAMMRTLGAVGFHQSYTYFAWRRGKAEIYEYLEELANDTAHVLRPTFWPTTHDILTPEMRGESMFALRAVLAATGAPSWGIYSGYELVEDEPRPGFEEPNDNEKYEFRPRNFQQPRAHRITSLLTKLNEARTTHPALQQLRGLKTLPTTSDDLVAYLKYVPRSRSLDHTFDAVITVVNINPGRRAEGMVYVDLTKLDMDLSYGRYQVRDLLDGATYTWSDANYVSLDPSERPAHVFAVEPLDTTI